MEERLQKILARQGYGSRRSTEELIIAKRVTVNGVPASLGTKADPAKDAIKVDGSLLSKEEPEKIYIALHKPQYVLSDVDPNDSRQTVMDLVPVKGHLFAVGRLDFDSEGLILLTNDGDLANRLTHPRYGHEKEYRVLVATRPDDEQMNTWRRGVIMEDGYKTAPAEVRVEKTFGKGTWLRVILREGRKRQIREVGSRIGLPVVRIIRIRIGTLELGPLKLREWRYLTPGEIRLLKEGATRKAEKRTTRRQTRPERPVSRRSGPGEKPAGRYGAAAGRSNRAEKPISRRSSAGERPMDGGLDSKRPNRSDRPLSSRRSSAGERLPAGGSESRRTNRTPGPLTSSRSPGERSSERSGTDSDRRSSSRPGTDRPRPVVKRPAVRRPAPKTGDGNKPGRKTK